MKNLVITLAVLVFLFSLLPVYGRFNRTAIANCREAYTKVEADRTRDFFGGDRGDDMAEMVIEKNRL